ncbi:hypothetical protein [Antarcticirhabdus aurantiaca]|uniref:Uncharacterized protein n=1 Tax=Antarcticirhabdus aurantiaca TaxID=2606717 RepID=A0ACD4NL75_9HYPH|nr:hypothetical protein [Antarcticirhabdus aurantiaca]WAJ27546.1 hypothetical protein OXU80_22295 [Jeongeuplla avenae]
MKIENFSRQVQVFLADLKSPEARSARLAQVARDGIADIRATNKAVTGSDTPPRVAVDGRVGAPLASVRPDGVIVAEFSLMREVLEWIGEELVKASPVLSGKYARSHVMIADNVEYEDPLEAPLTASKFLFVNRQAYSMKIEPRSYTVSRRDRSGPIGTRRRWTKTTRTGDGQSPQAPDGVYSAVSAVAATRFGNIAKVEFLRTYYDDDTGYSHPAIRVRPF